MSGLKAALTDRISERLPEAYRHSAECGKALLQIKRNIHNGRTIMASLREKATPGIPSALLHEIDAYGALARDIDQSRAALESTYRFEILAERQEILKLASSSNIASTINITNPDFASVLARLDEFARAKNERKVDQCAQTLLRFALRAGYKTSPLSGLGMVGFGAPVQHDARQAAPELPLDVSGQIHHRLDYRFQAIERITSHLLDRFIDLGPETPICLNDTIEVDGESIRWSYPKERFDHSAVVSGTRQDQASTSSSFVKLIYRLLIARPKMTIAELRTAVLGIAPQLAPKLDGLLQQVWESRFLQVGNLDVDHPLETLQQVALHLKPDLRSQVEGAIDKCKAALRSQARTSAPREALTELERIAGLTPTPEKFPSVVEDCQLDLNHLSPPKSVFPGQVEEFAALVHLIPMLTNEEPMRMIERWLVGKFTHEFGIGGECADPALFLGNAAETMRTLLDRGIPAEGTAKSFWDRLGVAPTIELTDALHAFLDHILKPGDHECVQLSTVEVMDLLRGIPKSQFPRQLAKLIFYQPFRDSKGSLIHAVNAIYPGFASMISRFLDKDSAEIREVDSYLNEICGEGGYAELVGHFGFNANYHHPIAKDNASLSSAIGRQMGSVKLSELTIKHNIEDNRLHFLNIDGKDIDILYLGVIQPFMLPTAYMLIQAMSQSVVRVPKLDRLLLDRVPQAESGIAKVPRVMVGSLMISRASIAIARSAIPDPSLNDLQFFIDFNTLADSLGMPEHVFYRFAALERLQPGPEAHPVRLTSARQDKPMPLDRTCPSMVRLFQRDLRKNELDVILAEAAPDFGQSVFSRNEALVVGEIGLEISVAPWS